MDPGRTVVASFEAEFAALRRTAELAIRQLDDAAIRRPIDVEANSVAILMQHVAGNLASRFTDFLVSDGEKPWRDRDAEFVDAFAPGAAGRAEVESCWSRGWGVLDRALAALDDGDLARTVLIRGEPHSVARALARALAHVGYHVGQVVQGARVLVGPADWKVITIPRGGSAEANRRLGFDPSAPRAPAPDRSDGSGGRSP